MYSMLETQKRGFIPPPEYLQLHHHYQQQQQQHHQGVLQTVSVGTPSHHPGLGNFSTYCHPGTALHPGFFPAAPAAGEDRARSTTTSPDGSLPDGDQRYAGGSAASPPTPPVTPGNRHQLLPALHHQQQTGPGHMTTSVSTTTGIRWTCFN